MSHSILISLLASASLAAPAVPSAPAAPAVPAVPAVPAMREARTLERDPVVKVWTDWDQYKRGDEIQVHARTRDDGYLVVLMADPDGRARVIYPLDPGDDNFVRGGRDISLPGRGGRGTFYVDGPAGIAIIYAAVSREPFHFTDFVRGDHWDNSLVYDKTLDDDAETGLTAIMDRMSAGHFDYDIARYEVIRQASYASEGVYVVPTIYGGPPCWATPYSPWCFGPPWLTGGYYGGYGPWPYYGGFGPGFFVGFGVGYGFGYGEYYGPYYGGFYGRGFYPCCYGRRYYGPGYFPPHYGFKPGHLGGGGTIGVGYRPPSTVPLAGGLGTPWRGTHVVGSSGSGGSLGPRTPGEFTGWRLGRGADARAAPATSPRSNSGAPVHRRPSSNGAPRGGDASGSAPGAPRDRGATPQYAPRAGGEPQRRTEPRGAAPAPRTGGGGSPHSTPAPRSGGGGNHGGGGNRGGGGGGGHGGGGGGGGRGRP
jgi:hypothetical protein